MRTYPHKPSESALREAWQESLKDYDVYTKKVEAARLSRNESFFKIRCAKILDLACLTYAFEAPLEQVRQFLTVACSCAERAVEFGVRLDPALYRTYMALAIVARQEEFRKKLQGMQRQEYTNSNIESDEVFYLAAEAMAALAAGQVATAQDITARALVRVRSEQVNNIVRSAVEPVLMLEAAVANNDAQSLKAAVTAQHDELRSSYSQKAAKGYPSGLLDVRGVAMLALARQYGVQAELSNVYMPRELIEEAD